jgi:putative iron-regulated protein
VARTRGPWYLPLVVGGLVVAEPVSTVSASRGAWRGKALSIAVIAVSVIAAGCFGDSNSAQGRAGRTGAEATRRAFLTTYADVARHGYADAVAAARELEFAVGELAARPSAAALAAARQAWRAARVPYLQTEAFRFCDGPIDEVEQFVNAWPIDEGFIEAVAAGSRPGIVDDVAARPALSQALLVSLNESEGEKSIATGFHALEFLLWGRDRSASGPGDRPFQDFLRDRPLGRRRAEYLTLTAGLLVKHLTTVAEAWAERPGSYRGTFLALPSARALGLVIKAVGTFVGPELAGERTTVAYVTKDQENEHSCFSDTTTQDLVLNVTGVRNVMLGRYQSVAGTGLLEVIAEARPPLASQLAAAVDAALAAVNAIPAPFDQAILGKDGASGRQAIQRAITSLRATADLLAETVPALGLSVTL